MVKIYKITFFFFLLGLAPLSADAATLSFSPASGEYAVDKILSVNVYVSSADQALNAASGIISFPQDKLEVTSLSKNGSIFTLWVQEPSFSNSAGTVNFEGIVLNPGFTGSSGKAITITFRTKAAGAAPLTFASGSALANDGKGTNILASLGNAKFNLGGAAPTIPESTTPSIVSGTPSAPQISSPTHPDSEKWYAKKDAKFSWSVPSGVTSVRLLFGKIPTAIPTVVYASAISEKEITSLADGIWYFHVQLRNANGLGEVSHFRFQIDTKPPEPFSIKFIDPVRGDTSNGVDGNETENPRPTIVFDTTDSLSGIDYYKIKIGEGDFFPVAPEIGKSNPYTLPHQNPGKRNILVQAFDKAGNYFVATEDFTIKPLPAPVITECPKKSQISFLSVLVPLVLLIAVLLFILWRGWHKSSLSRKRLRKEVREVGPALHKTFDLLKENIREHIKMLEKTHTKRQLTEEEEKILKQLKKDLDTAEKFVQKEIEDIEKEIK